MSENASQMFKVTIDGKTVSVPPNTTILEAAQEAGAEIPFLCHEKRLRPFGACRVCLVNVEAMPGRLIPACTTPVADGMVVVTSNEDIDKARRTVLELLLVHHPLDCPVCDKAGECKLQDLVYKYGPTENRYLYAQERAGDKIDNRSPFIERNNNRCVLCGACARICNEVQGVGEISFVNRGFAAMVGTCYDQPLNCEFCGQCISACPVGALNNSLFSNRIRVWDLDSVETTCGICGNGCTYKVDYRNNEIYRIVFDSDKGINRGALCGKGRFGYNYLVNEDRITAPLIKKDGEFVESTWDEAMDFIAENLRGIIEQDSPSAVGVVGPSHGTNEDAKALRLLFGDLLRVPNLDSQSRYFMSPTLDVIGPDTATYDDVDEADMFLFIDSALTNSMPVLGNRIIQRSRLDEAPMVVVDSRRTKQTRFAKVWLQNKPGSSAEVLAGLCALAEVSDPALAGLAKTDAVISKSGLDEKALKKAAALLKKAKKPMIVLGTVPYADALNKKTAQLAYHAAKALGAKVLVPSEKANLRGLWKYGVSPIGDGLNASEMFDQAGQSIKAMMIFGDNPLVTFPAKFDWAEKLQKLSLLVVSDMFMTATTKFADVILPGVSPFERGGTLTNFEDREQELHKAVSAPGEARPILDTIIDLSARMRHDVTLGDIVKAEAKVQWTEPALPALDFEPVSAPADRPVYAQTGPVLYHCGTLTTYSEDLMKVYGETSIEINPEDAKQAQVADGDKVRLVSESGEAIGKAKVTRDVMPGTVFAPLHFAQSGVNRLFGTLDSEPSYVRIEKA